MSHIERQRVRATSAVEHMERRGTLTPRQAAAARRLHAAYLLGVLGSRQESGKVSGAGGNYIDARVAAIRDYERARDVLGGRIWPVVWAVVCGDQSVQDAAAERKQNATATATLLRLGLDLAADHYRLPDRT